MCRYCEQKRKLDQDNTYFDFDNQIEIASGGWTSLYIGVNKENKIVLRACGDGLTDDCVINYCPFCGRKLNLEEKDE